MSEQQTYIFQPNESTKKVAFSQKLTGEDILIDFEVTLTDILETE